MPEDRTVAAVPAPGSVVPLTQEHVEELLWVDHAAFPSPPDPGNPHDYIEWDRTFGLRTDDGELAGIDTTFSLSVALPDGASPTGTRTVPMAGLSWVGVHPGHRRRGVLTAMIRHHLHDLHERQAEPVSGLHASEPVIYGRFGYGLATVGYRVQLGRGVSLRELAGSDDVRVRFLSADPDEHAELVAGLYSRACSRQPGMVDRTTALTRRELWLSPREREKGEPLRLLVAEREGEPTGYAIVQREMSWENAIPGGSTELRELAAVDDVTEHRLWRAVTDFDLTSTTKAWRVGPHHPLLSWLVDVRAAQPTLTDELWLRLVDVDRALAARGYAGDVDVVLGVTDALCPWNERTWRLSGGPTGATCSATTDAPEVRVDVRELGSALAGGTTMLALSRAGLVQEERRGAVAALSTAMRAAVEPATTYGF